jgi:hypothetical protein
MSLDPHFPSKGQLDSTEANEKKFDDDSDESTHRLV